MGKVIGHAEAKKMDVHFQPDTMRELAIWHTSVHEVMVSFLKEVGPLLDNSAAVTCIVDGERALMAYYRFSKFAQAALAFCKETEDFCSARGLIVAFKEGGN